jgi:hypothetical protein
MNLMSGSVDDTVCVRVMLVEWLLLSRDYNLDVYGSS